MFSHEPKDYSCPFCNFLAGKITDYNKPEDIVYKNKSVTAFIAPTEWFNNMGNVLVIPNVHYENIYDIPDEEITEVYEAVKKIAIAIRLTYGCDGISTGQHNEPAGDQEVYHFHTHVFPRYVDDELYLSHGKRGFVDAATRAPYAKKLRAYFAEHTD
jgi:histidine triad (HIT) family protein